MSRGINVLRAPETPKDHLSSAQVGEYLALLGSKDLEAFSSSSFTENASRALASDGANGSDQENALASAVLSCLCGDLVQQQNALREEFAQKEAMHHVVQAFGRSKNGGLSVARDDFADFVRFCVAYRIHCYFETSRMPSGGPNSSRSNGSTVPQSRADTARCPRVVFVLGGPGAGKGTQCEKISNVFGYAHLSAGDLLREERQRPGSQYGELIENYIKEGKIVPVEVTIKLIKQAMEKRGWENGKYLIDGFPRSLDNLDGWNEIMAGSVLLQFALVFNCSEACMEARLLERGKTSGRSDDNLETIKKRFRTFQNDSMPVLARLDTQGLVRTVQAEKPLEEVWRRVRAVFGPTVVFVLGGPGAGKGTQCTRIAESFGYHHLSAGDLLREERQRPGSKEGQLIEDHIREGKLVPAWITVRLMIKAMERYGWAGGRYLIDGFPRSTDNLQAWAETMGEQAVIKFAIYFDCSEGVMESRLLERGKTSGRSDDNLQSIRKRFLTFHKDSMPVVEMFDKQGVLRKVDAERDTETVWRDVQTLFGPSVIFVLGGPCSGKSTQCTRIADMFAYTPLVVGELLTREQQRPESRHKEEIERCVREGMLVPAEITVELLRRAMQERGWEDGQYVIEGFPPNVEHLMDWNRLLGGKVNLRFSIFLDAPESAMETRLIGRAGANDTAQFIKRRLMAHEVESRPVVEHLGCEGKVRRIDAGQAADVVWTNVQRIFGPTVIFVMGVPGAGKGTQCQRIALNLGFKHISVGDLLREEGARLGSERAEQIQRCVRQGVLVPTETVVMMLQQAMEQQGWEGGRYVIDGFPRSLENLEAWDAALGNKVCVKLAILYECLEATAESRLLEYSKTSGRVDDNAETIRKRFATFHQESLPVALKLAASAILRKVSAEQSIEEVWSSTQEVLRNELSAHVVNQAVVLVKPHAHGPDTDRFVQSYFVKNKIAVVKKGTVSATEFSEKGLFDKQYFQIVAYASADPSTLQVSAAGQELFRQKEALTWADAVSQHLVVGAVAALQQLGLSEEDLFHAWGRTHVTKLAQFLSVGLVQGKGGRSAYVINGFVPFWRGTFLRNGSQGISWFAVQFSPDQVSWRCFRANILGATDPAQAAKGSLRAEMYEHWRTLGLAERPNILDNCLHASAGPLEGLRERMMWTSVSINEDDLGRFLLASGIPQASIEEWFENVDVYGWRVGHESRAGPVFECTQDCDTREFRDSAVQHLRALKGKLDFWSVSVKANQSRFHGPARSRSEAKAEKMTILHFNDVYNVEPRVKEPVGGVARFVTRMRELKAESISRGEPEAVVLFSGDAFNPSLTSTMTMGKHMVPALNAIGIHTACYGNHDFDFGVENLTKMASENNFPWLISNVTSKATGRPLADGMITRMLNFHGRKVGLIGLVEKEWLVTLATLDPSDVDFEDFCACARRLARQLKGKQGAEIVVALTHMRVPNDELLAHEVEEVDIILGGHDHHYDVKPVGPHGTYVLKSGTDFRDITALTLDFSQREGSKNFKVANWTHEEIKSDIQEDPEMKVFVDQCMSKLGASMDKVIGESAVDLDCRFAMIRTQETNIGNFVCDVLRYGLKADLAVLNSGTLRADAVIEKGGFRMRDLVNLLPMLDELCLLQMSGAQLMSVFENSVSQYPRLEGRFAQVSGVSFEFDAARPGGQRVVEGSVKIGGEPLEMQRLYKLVTKDYLRQGKDGYDVFREAVCLADGEQAGILPTMVREYFKEISALNGYSTSTATDATRLAVKRLDDLKLVGDGPASLQTYAIDPKVENRIVCRNPVT